MTDQQLNDAIDQSSKVTVRLIIGALGLAVPLLLTGTAFLWSLQSKVGTVAETVQRMQEDRYSLPMATADAMREAIANPGHRVPDPSNPGTYIQVNSANVITP